MQRCAGIFNFKQMKETVDKVSDIFTYAVTGTFHGAIVTAKSEGEARRLFHKRYNGESILCSHKRDDRYFKTLSTPHYDKIVCSDSGIIKPVRELTISETARNYKDWSSKLLTYIQMEERKPFFCTQCSIFLDTSDFILDECCPECESSEYIIVNDLLDEEEDGDPFGVL